MLTSLSHCHLCSCRPVLVGLHLFSFFRGWRCTGSAPCLQLTLTLSPTRCFTVLLFFSLSLFQGEKSHNVVSRFLNAQPTQGPGNPIAKMCTPLCTRMQPQRCADTTPPTRVSPSSVYHPWFRAFPGVGTRAVSWPLPGQNFGRSGGCWGAMWYAMHVT